MPGEKRGISVAVFVFTIILVLAAGLVAGYSFRESIKKILTGQNTADEIKQAVDSELTKLTQREDNFELEGIVTDIDINATSTKVKVTSASPQIKNLESTEVSILTSEVLKVNHNNRNDFRYTDTPINSLVKIGGVVKLGKLSATEFTIKQLDAWADSADQQKTKETFLGGKVANIGADSLTLNVITASKNSEAQKGKQLTLKVYGNSFFTRGNLPVSSTNIKVGEEILIKATVDQNNYSVSEGKVKVNGSSK